MFSQKLINYAVKAINNSEAVLIFIQDLKEPKYLFDFKKNPKDLAAEEADSEVNKAILAARVRQYVK